MNWPLKDGEVLGEVAEHAGEKTGLPWAEYWG